MGKPFCVYILLCADHSYYVGQTDDLEQRMVQHHEGGKCHYTTKRRPVELVWSHCFPTRDQAKAAELQLKGWSRAKKEALIRGDFAALPVLSKKRDWEGHRQRKSGQDMSTELKGRTDTPSALSMPVNDGM